MQGKYSATTTAKKGLVEGGSNATIVTALAALAIQWLRANTDLEIGPETHALVAAGIGALAGMLSGGWRAARNWWKHR